MKCKKDNGYGKCKLKKSHSGNHMTEDKIRWGHDCEVAR